MGLRSGDCGGCMSRVTWHVILLEATFRKLEHCGHKGMNMVSSNTQKKKKAQLVLRSPKCTKTRKYPPLHCTTTIYFCVPLVGSHSWFLPASPCLSSSLYYCKVFTLQFKAPCDDCCFDVVPYVLKWIELNFSLLDFLDLSTKVSLLLLVNLMLPFWIHIWTLQQENFVIRQGVGTNSKVLLRF